MKKFILLLSAAFAVSQMALRADIVIPGADGQDCGLTITQNTVIDLSLATTAKWNASYNSLAAADPNRVVDDFIGKGVYDAEKWAVVFRYTDVNIAAGATVTFKNHPSRAPVVWLVSGNVNIAGTVSLNGQERQSPPAQSEPGPGGFRGGTGRYTAQTPSSVDRLGGDGMGPGGGDREAFRTNGAGGSYATIATTNSEIRPIIYGNPSLVPLIGGSGGGANGGGNGQMGGGAGGGAFLIACEGIVEIVGSISANGGSGNSGSLSPNSGAGSGGGIRLVCSTLAGNGVLSAVGGVITPGGLGRIRLERELNSNTLSVTPSASSQFLAAGATAVIWPPDTAPRARLVTLGADVAPADPRSAFGGSQGPDLIVGGVPTSQAVIETTNLPQVGSQVQVRITPQHGAEYSVVNAVFQSQISADPLVLRWAANVPITNGYSAIQVRIVAP